MTTACGEWQTLDGNYRGLHDGEVILMLDRAFSEPDGFSNDLKPPVREWLNNAFGFGNYGFVGVGFRDKLIFKTKEDAVLFQLFWDHAVAELK